MNRLLALFRHKSRGGVNRVIVILLVLIAVMLVLIAMPSWDSFREQSERIACEQAMKTARDGLIIDFFDNWEAGSVEDAMLTLDEVMPARANICPSGGTVYLIRGANRIFEPICGLHDTDVKRRTRLNASRAMELMTEALNTARKRSSKEPDSVKITLNGQTLEIERVAKKPRLRRGTATTNGFEGVVAFYGLAGEGDFADVDAKSGMVCYFIYADEDYCATWRLDDGWTGDAYT